MRKRNDSTRLGKLGAAAATVAAVAMIGGAGLVWTDTDAAAVTPKVANGEDAPEGAYPFAAKSTMTDIPKPDGSTYDSACSGALVAPLWVITAGHCFHDVDGDPVEGPPQYGGTTVTLGVTDLADPDARVLDVVDVKQNPTTDMALAKLDEPVTDIAPLPLNREAVDGKTIVRLTGWGATSADGEPAERLQTGQFTVEEQDDRWVRVTGYAPSRDTSSCPYDSGAPFFAEPDSGPLLVSVESGGPSCPHGELERTARVDTSVEWIEQHIA